MKRIFLFLACAVMAYAQSALLVVSIDGMRPDYVLKADEHGLKIPHLRQLLKNGTHASGVRGVLPTVTYPSHTTILTGVWPSKHGIYSNEVLDPLGLNLQGWYWYAEDIRVPTLWDAAAQAGMKIGSVSWPVSVGAKSVTYLIPEYWRAPKFPDDIKLLRALSTPGLINEIQKHAGLYITDLDAGVQGDWQRTKYAVAILRDKKVQLMTVHLAALDHLEHHDGPFSPEANAALEELDKQLGQLEQAIKAAYPNATICVLSDHGFAATDHRFDILKPFIDAGLVTVGQTGTITGWKAYPKQDGGSAAVYLKDPRDSATQQKVRELLQHLAADPANGIQRILDKAGIDKMGGDPNAAFWVDMKPNFLVQSSVAPAARLNKGTHGFLPTHDDLLASFFIAGPGIQPGRDLGIIDMRSVAPTLAHCLGLPFPTADRPSLF